ncbi:hypothetical protein B0H34DRAFT_325605 [Crassisporium funariophilum]|nr:hypothetical protein B0H34DRAFT_325605 [Crassisporium funariophilum]
MSTASSSSFKPSLGSSAQNPRNIITGQASRRQTNMGPPPTPQQFRNQQPSTSAAPSAFQNGLVPQNARLAPPSGRPIIDSARASISNQAPSSAAPQRFFTMAAQSTTNQFNSGSRAPSRASMPNIRGSGGHRTPFNPDISQQGGFG